MNQLKTIGDLIEHLESLGRDKTLIADFDGSTYTITSHVFQVWDVDDDDSPVALMIDNI